MFAWCMDALVSGIQMNVSKNLDKFYFLCLFVAGKSSVAAFSHLPEATQHEKDLFRCVKVSLTIHPSFLALRLVTF